MNRTPLHTCSFCGGKVFQTQEDIILKFPKRIAFIEEAEIGKCEECGAHYHLPETSLRIEKKSEKLIQERQISKRDLSKIEFFYASELPIDESLITPSLQKRIEALELTVGASA